MDESAEHRDPLSPEDLPVTGVASRRVKPGRKAEFEEWIYGILAAANEVPGYLGSNIIRPSDPEDDEYQIVFKFDRASNLKRWQDSDERRRWNERARDLIREEPKIRVLTGLETWFTLPSKGDPPPPRYKMAIVTWLAIFPLITVIFALFTPQLDQLPFGALLGPDRSYGLAHDLHRDAADDPPLLLLALP